MARDISPSSLRRALECPASHVLPQIGHESEAQTKGSVVHEFLYQARNVGRGPALELVPDEYRAFCESIDCAELKLESNAIRGEVAFEYDLQGDKAIEIGQNLGRKYPNRAGKMYGTADAVARIFDMVWICDYAVSNSDYKGRVSANLQLQAYALFAARMFNVEHAVITIATIRADGSVGFETDELDSFDLDQVRAAILTARRAIQSEGAAEQVKTGSWCRYCDAILSCPARALKVAPLADELTQAIQELSRDDISRLWPVYENAQRLLKDFRSVAEELVARFGEVGLDDGRSLTVKEQSIERVDARSAERAIRAIYPDADCARLYDDRTSKQRIREVLRANIGPDETVSGAEERVLTDVRVNHGATVITSQRFICR